MDTTDNCQMENGGTIPLIVTEPESPQSPPTNLTTFRKRMSVQNLELPPLDIDKANKLAIPTATRCMIASPECRTLMEGGGSECKCHEDVKEEGRELFCNFVRDEIHRRGLGERLSPLIVDTPIGYQNPMWAKAGRELREMADAFSRTKARQRVKDSACEIAISDMSYCQFQDLLAELFREGITIEQILILFFFCSDMAIQILEKTAVNMFRQCMDWTMRFITERVCTWVAQHGGWGAVLSKSVQFVGGRVIVVCAVVAVTIAFWHFLKR